VDPIPGGSANPYDYAMQSPFAYYDLDGRKSLKKRAKDAANKLKKAAKKGAAEAKRIGAKAVSYVGTKVNFGLAGASDAFSVASRAARVGSKLLGYVAAAACVFVTMSEPSLNPISSRLENSFSLKRFAECVDSRTWLD
jgi:hypothetical protein